MNIVKKILYFKWILLLQEMVKNYESTNDKWRAFGYQKAIQAIRRCPKEISSWEVLFELSNYANSMLIIIITGA